MNLRNTLRHKGLLGL